MACIYISQYMIIFGIFPRTIVLLKQWHREFRKSGSLMVD